jgi:hypothetical protein
MLTKRGSVMSDLCPGHDALYALFRGELSDEEETRWSQHVRVCDTCTRYLEVLREVWGLPTPKPAAREMYDALPSWVKERALEYFNDFVVGGLPMPKPFDEEWFRKLLERRSE